jgi:hypothetical protein
MCDVFESRGCQLTIGSNEFSEVSDPSQTRESLITDFVTARYHNAVETAGKLGND